MKDPSTRSALEQPPLWAGVLFCAFLAGLVAWLRLGLYGHTSVGVGYSLPIVLVGWTRRRRLVWGMCIIFALMAAFKFWWNLDQSTMPMHQRFIGMMSLMGDLLVVAGIVDMVIRHAALMQFRGHELQRRGQELRMSNQGLSERQETMETLLKLSRSLTVGLSQPKVFAAIAETIRRLLGDSIVPTMWDGSGQEIAMVGGEGVGGEGAERAGANGGESFASLVMKSQKPVGVGNVALRPEMTPAVGRHGETFQAMLGVPLKAGADIVAALVIYSPHVRSWTESDISLMESLAAQASVSIAATKLVEEIENEHGQLQTIVDTVPFGIIRTNARGTRLSCNPAGASMLGFPELVETTRQNWPKAKLIGPEGEIPAGQDPLMRALHGEVTAAMELEVHLPDGQKLTALCNAAPIRDRSGAISGAVGGFVDISAQKSLREELERRRREAEEASVRKSRFLAAVSHDIRTPANAISLLAELIRRSVNDPTQADEIPEMAHELERSSMSLVQLVSDVLDLTRLDLGRFELREAEFDLGEWAAEECRQLQPLAEKKQLEFGCEGPKSKIRVRTDRIKLSRVLTNLVGNAIKFTERGRVRVEVSVAADRRLRISVTDTGVGIAVEHQTLIFDEFAQLKNPDRAKGGGSGLGLSICKRLVGLMGGTLEVVSSPGKGSTFSFSLPSSCTIE